MNMTFLTIYLMGWMITGTALVDEFKWRDVAASYLAGSLWFILVPAAILRKIL